MPSAHAGVKAKASRLRRALTPAPLRACCSAWLDAGMRPAGRTISDQNEGHSGFQSGHTHCRRRHRVRGRRSHPAEESDGKSLTALQILTT